MNMGRKPLANVQASMLLLKHIHWAHKQSILRTEHTESTPREHSENIQITFREHSEHIQNTPRAYSEQTQSTLREHSDPDQRTSRSEHIQSPLREYLVSTCKTYFLVPRTDFLYLLFIVENICPVVAGQYYTFPGLYSLSLRCCQVAFEAKHFLYKLNSTSILSSG